MTPPWTECLAGGRQGGKGGMRRSEERGCVTWWLSDEDEQINLRRAQVRAKGRSESVREIGLLWFLAFQGRFEHRRSCT